MLTRTPLEDALLRLSQAEKAHLERLKEGIYLEASLKRSIEDLRHQAVADRLDLGDSFLAAGTALLRKRPAQNRAAVGRFYYSMYHAMRAVVFFKVGGDDYQDHSKLPKYIPGDFPNQLTWQNDLKDARLRRNEADYEAYPTSDSDFRQVAIDLERLAKLLASESRQYLSGKGCKYV